MELFHCMWNLKFKSKTHTALARHSPPIFIMNILKKHFLYKSNNH